MIRIPQPKKVQLGQIGKKIYSDPKKLFEEENNVYHECMKQAANLIAEDKNNKIILLCGPSSSGKTTSAHLISRYLKQQNINAVTISLDDFYLGRDKAPRLADGRFDYETVEALNIPQLQRCILDLIDTGYCEKPQFDFVTGTPEEKLYPVSLGKNDIAIFEGIHALNPLIVDSLPRENLFKIYVSVRDGIYDGASILFTPREIRFMRRLVRDSKFRNSTAQNTLSMWTGVIMGEDKYINPYKDTADLHINSLHSFEPFIYKKDVEELFKNISLKDENYRLAMDILTDLKKVDYVSEKSIPSDCVVREFIGNQTQEGEKI